MLTDSFSNHLAESVCGQIFQLGCLCHLASALLSVPSQHQRLREITLPANYVIPIFAGKRDT